MRGKRRMIGNDLMDKDERQLGTMVELAMDGACWFHSLLSYRFYFTFPDMPCIRTP